MVSRRSMTSSICLSSDMRNGICDGPMLPFWETMGAFLGYYTLASGKIGAKSFRANQGKKFPRQTVRVVLLALLAVDQRGHG